MDTLSLSSAQLVTFAETFLNCIEQGFTAEVASKAATHAMIVMGVAA